MNALLKPLFVVFLLIVPYAVLAHDGVHMQSGPAHNRIWRYADKRPAAEGRFLMMGKGRVYITTSTDSIRSFGLSQLSWMDKQYVERETARIAQLNDYQFDSVNSASTGDAAQLPLAMGLLMLLMTLVSGCMVVARYWPVHVSVAGLRLAGFVLFAVVILACKKEIETVVANLKTDPTVVDAAFAPYKSLVKTRWDNTYFYVESGGIPAHNMMVGITNWQQQVPIPQSYSATNAWSIPLAPQLATSPLSTKTNFMKGAIAIAANGIPIFNPLNNRGEDSYLIGELDQWGGHCGKADDYHYHIPPLHLQTTSGNLPIAYALDGYAVYGSKEPDGTAMLPLDDYHGHMGSNGVYHYHGTTTYPYMIGSMRGTVSLDPTTPAPENQIIPQAATKPIRPALTPLNGAKITSFAAVGVNGYSLQYQLNTKPGYINYSWDATKYTFVFTDTNGSTTTQTYAR